MSKVSRLTNSFMFYITDVLIVEEDNQNNCDNMYRLIVSNGSTVLFENRYNTSKGAKIGFSRKYGDRSNEEGLRLFWTDFYETAEGCPEIYEPVEVLQDAGEAVCVLS